MRFSKLFSATRREIPAGCDTASHALLVRAGYIRSLASGIFTYLPLAQRSLTQIANIMRSEINAIGGQEICMPVIHPAEIWKETGRWYSIGSEMGRFKDKNDRDMVLAMTHEEIVAWLVRDEIHYERQLPALLYHIQTKWRDDPRPRAGLIRAREFTMLDSYSLDANWEGLDAQYQAHYDAYHRIFSRCGLSVIAVQADVGMMGGSLAHEYMYLTPIGEDTIITCPKCGYCANRQVALFRKTRGEQTPPRPVEKVATPHASTIDELAQYLNISAASTSKAVFMIAETGDEKAPEKFIFAVIRGDMEVNETKLANAVKARDLRPATEEEIRAIGAEPGYASPIGIKKEKVFVIVDDLIPQCSNLVAGANQNGYHLLNVNYGRDYTADLVCDIAAAGAGSACPECSTALTADRGVEVANIFKLGTRYTQALGCTFQDANGQKQPIIMGSYGIGLGRLLACIAEEHHDERGLALPPAIAPYPVALVSLSSQNAEVENKAGALAETLTAAGLEPLYDDRSETAGVKFNDADLIGLPLRITVSERSLRQGGAELKLRSAPETITVPLESVTSEAKRLLETYPKNTKTK